MSFVDFPNHNLTLFLLRNQLRSSSYVQKRKKETDYYYIREKRSGALFKKCRQLLKKKKRSPTDDANQQDRERVRLRWKKGSHSPQKTTETQNQLVDVAPSAASQRGRWGLIRQKNKERKNRESMSTQEFECCIYWRRRRDLRVYWHHWCSRCVERESNGISLSTARILEQKRKLEIFAKHNPVLVFRSADGRTKGRSSFALGLGEIAMSTRCLITKCSVFWGPFLLKGDLATQTVIIEWSRSPQSVSGAWKSNCHEIIPDCLKDGATFCLTLRIKELLVNWLMISIGMYIRLRYGWRWSHGDFVVAWQEKKSSFYKSPRI